MKKKAAINYKNKFSINHKPIMKGLHLIGLADLFHDPRTGFTVLISEDKPFSAEWHEGAHHYLSQRSILGFILNTLSNILYVLAFNLINKNIDLSILKKIQIIHFIREALIDCYNIPHEIFAINTEFHGIIQNIKGSNNFTSENLKIVKSEIEKIENRIRGLPSSSHHHIALGWSYKLADTFRDIFAPKFISEWIATFPLLEFLTIPFNDLLLKNKDELKMITPYPTHLFKWLVENKSANLNDEVYSLLLKYEKFDKRISKLIDSPYLFQWIESIRTFLVDNNITTDVFDYALANDMNYLLITPEKISEWEKKAEFKTLDENLTQVQTEKVLSMCNSLRYFLSNLLKKEIYSDKILIQDSLHIPPPITLTTEDDKLVFNIRSDINTPQALSYISLKLVDLPFADTVLDHRSRPIFCIQSLYKDNRLKCKEGLGKCATSSMLLGFYNSSGVNFGLVCCKENEATILNVSELIKKKPNIFTGKFEIKEVPLNLKGIYYK